MVWLSPGPVGLVLAVLPGILVLLPCFVLSLLPGLLGAGRRGHGLPLLLPPGHRVAADGDDRRGTEGDPRATLRGRAKGDPGPRAVLPGSGLRKKHHDI